MSKKLMKLTKRPTANWSLTLPVEAREKFKDIDYMEFEILEEGIMYRPVKV